MKASEADILLVPGAGKPDANHWQARWQARLSTARRVEQASYEKPVAADWIANIREAIASSTRPVVLVAHSIGICATLHAVRESSSRIAGGFFVSPPDLEGAGPDRRYFRGFAPYPTGPLAFPSITIASRNDENGSYEHAGDLANAWGSLLIDAGNSGHIDVKSGHGPWPEGSMVFAQFMARLRA